MSAKLQAGTSTPSLSCPVTPLSQAFDPFDGEPYAVYSRARREEPVFYSPRIGYWVVTRYADVERIMLDSDTFSATNVLELFKPICPAAAKIAIESDVRISLSIVDEDPPIHIRHRKAPRKPFSPTQIVKLEPRVREWVTQDEFNNLAAYFHSRLRGTQKGARHIRPRGTILRSRRLSRQERGGDVFECRSVSSI